MTLSQNTRLQRLPNIQLELDAQNFITIKRDQKSVKCGANGLAILELFQQPHTLTDALEMLKQHVKGQQAWLSLTADILYLHEKGILQDVDAPISTSRLAKTQETFAYPRIHIQMLNDIQRTTAYLAAIQAVVCPADVVLEIGTGTGVLATKAAQVGAHQVYAVEATAIRNVAQTIFANNQVAEKIDIMAGWSTEIDLPQRADVLISEIIGNDPFDEKVLEITRDATQRLLKPDARLIPSHMRVYAIPFAIPDDFWQTVAVSDINLSTWQTAYKINFTPFQKATQQEAYGVAIAPHRTHNWLALSAPVHLTEIDFTQIESLIVDKVAEGQAQNEGWVQGIMIYPDLQLSPEIVLSRHPQEVDETCSWRSYIWIFNDPLFLKKGDTFKIHYHYGKSTTVTIEKYG